MTTPADLLANVYRVMRDEACNDVRANLHVPPTMAAVVCSPHNPPELRVIEILDARSAPHLMRAVFEANPAIFGFSFLTVGTTIHEQYSNPNEVHPALLCLWCTAHDAGGDSYRITPHILDAPLPLPDALRDLYTSVFDLTVTLPPMLSPTPH